MRDSTAVSGSFLLKTFSYKAVMKSKKPGVKQLQQLAAKVLSGKATPAEKAFLDSYYDVFDSPNNKTDDLPAGDAKQLAAEIKAQLNRTTSKPVGVLKQMKFYPIAASLTLMFALGFWAAYKHFTGFNSKQNQTASVRPIVPGGNKATLTLANGSKISLGDHSIAALSKLPGVKISTTKNGQLIYRVISVGGGPANGKQLNTMETPRGGIYQIYLPDGTHVWLNSATKLTYPVAFTGHERRVELSGEAYFEVAHNPAKPFKVISKDQEIEVLGTHFNVNAYADEPNFRTTLLKGSIKITATTSGAAKIIQPGQQAVLRQTGIQVHKADTDNAIAWETGTFSFDNEPITSIMKKISRWYDVDIVYTDDVSDMRFGGTVSRFADINKVLSKLQLTNTVHFKIDGRRILVMK